MAAAASSGREMVPKQRKERETSADDAASYFSIAIYQVISGVTGDFRTTAYVPQEAGLRVDICEVFCLGEFDFKEDAYYAAYIGTAFPSVNLMVSEIGIANETPNPKIADIPILRFVLICNFHTMCTAMESIARSEKVLKAAEVMYNDLLSRQFPGMSGLQILHRGRQANIARKNAMA